MARFEVSSRFSGLMIEDDDSPPNTLQQKAKKVIKITATKPEPAKTTKSQPTKSQTAAKKKKKLNTVSSEQWEQWKQRDEELVDGNYEDELQQIKKDTEKKKHLDEQAAKNKNKKMKKKNAMSLNQFNDMLNGEEGSNIPNEDENVAIEEKSPVKDTQFFERVKIETKNELLKDKNKDRVRNRLTASDEVITRVQFLDTLERKDKEIAGLHLELAKLKQELITVKSRNKKLCNILGQGEMKDKAEVLMEVERLRGVQTELTAELASLHTDLEKARSMNSDPRAKDKKSGAKKKNIRFDVSAEALLSKESGSGTAG